MPDRRPSLFSVFKTSKRRATRPALPFLFSGPERTRTSNLRFRRPTLYPIELRALEVPASPALSVWYRDSPGKARPAEREGFEPSIPVRYTPLAGERLQPLGHLSLPSSSYSPVKEPAVETTVGTEEVGFEPTKLALAGFQDRCLRPLGHSSSSGPPGICSSQGRGVYPCRRARQAIFAMPMLCFGSVSLTSQQWTGPRP